MTFIYRGIALFVLAFVLRCMLREKDFWKQVTATMVIVPLAMRILLIK